MRVVIAEDQALLREGLARLFHDAGHDVVAAWPATPRRCAAWSARTCPTSSSSTSGCRRPTPTRASALARWVREQHPAVGVLVLSQHVEHGGVVDLVSRPRLRLPAQGPGARRGRLPRRRRAGGRRRLGARPRRGGHAASARDDDALARLSAREREVLGLMAEGLTNAGIAERLLLTERTVESHVRSVFMKLGLRATATATGGCSRCCRTSGRWPEPVSVAARTAGLVLASMPGRYPGFLASRDHPKPSPGAHHDQHPRRRRRRRHVPQAALRRPLPRHPVRPRLDPHVGHGPAGEGSSGVCPRRRGVASPVSSRCGGARRPGGGVPASSSAPRWP